MEEREIKRDGIVWLDVTDPSPEELNSLVVRFGLHATSVQDCLQPEHLPKAEKIDQTHFIILRSYDWECDKRVDTIQGLTRKVAVFYGENFVITVHRTPLPLVQKVYEIWNRKEKFSSMAPLKIVCDLFLQVIKTYEPATDEAFQRFEHFESHVFHNNHRMKMHQSYLLKRRVSIMKRMLWRMHGLLPEIAAEAPKELRPMVKNIRDAVEQLTFQLDEIHDNMNSLLSFYLSLESQKTNEASHKTNEVVRILTIFSVFFMPLNFIAGVYGMNFEHMPELQHHLGYPTVLAAMVTISMGVFVWFRRKNWL